MDINSLLKSIMPGAEAKLRDQSQNVITSVSVYVGLLRKSGILLNITTRKFDPPKGLKFDEQAMQSFQDLMRFERILGYVQMAVSYEPGRRAINQEAKESLIQAVGKDIFKHLDERDPETLACAIVAHGFRKLVKYEYAYMHTMHRLTYGKMQFIDLHKFLTNMLRLSMSQLIGSPFEDHATVYRPSVEDCEPIVDAQLRATFKSFMVMEDSLIPLDWSTNERFLKNPAVPNMQGHAG